MARSIRPSRPARGGPHVSAARATAFRLGRHRLTERAPPGALVAVVSGMAGAQAQILGAARSSISARVRDLVESDVDRAIWHDRTLTRLWCMRRTLYVVPASEAAVYVRGSARRAEKEVRWMRNRGVPAAVLEGFLESVLAALDEPITRSELTARVGRSLGLPVRWVPGGGWGSDRKIPGLKVGGLSVPAVYLLHLAGARGVLCSGLNRGTEATFVRADSWIPGWRDVPVPEAEVELLRRYLRAFGPATAEDFHAWTQMRLSDARETWARLEGELAPVDLEGRPAWVLKADLRALEAAETRSPTVRLLPYFDSFLLGSRERGHLVDSTYARAVYLSQGWIAPVVLVDGRVQGIWRQAAREGRLNIRAEMFGRVSAPVGAAICDDAEQLARFLGFDGVDVSVGRGSTAGITTARASP